MGSMSAVHWLMVALVALLFFGPKRLAEAGKGLGEGIKNFKKGVSENDEEKPKLPGKDADSEKRLSGPSQSA